MSSNAGTNALVSATLAAELLGVNAVTVHRWAKAGLIAAQKLPGRTGAYVIDRAEVDRVIASRAARKDAA